MSNVTLGLLDKKIDISYIRNTINYKMYDENDLAHCKQKYTTEKYKPPKPRKLKTEYVEFPTSYYHPKMD